ncbi:MAG: hypothetical protein QOI76_4301, partial [Frankiales bacterium]|nr:hypothetical protein [Frankiales bacterium]
MGSLRLGKVDSHGNVSYSMPFSHRNQQLLYGPTTATTNAYGASSS